MERHQWDLENLEFRRQLNNLTYSMRIQQEQNNASFEYVMESFKEIASQIMVWAPPIAFAHPLLQLVDGLGRSPF